MNSVPDLMNYLFQRQAPCTPPEALADIFEHLVWCLDDNGAELPKAWPLHQGWQI